MFEIHIDTVTGQWVYVTNGYGNDYTALLVVDGEITQKLVYGQFSHLI